jgi:hypothetical protein
MAIEGITATIHRAYTGLFAILIFCLNSAAFADVHTLPITVNVNVQPGLEVVSSLEPDYDFNAIEVPNDPAQIIEVSPFYAYANDTNTSVNITLTTGNGQSDTNSTWMNPSNDPGNTDKVYYNIVYYPCAPTPPAVNLSDNSITPITAGISCANHTCTIGNAYANATVCDAHNGYLNIIRTDIGAIPNDDLYTGQITLTESLL